VSILAIVGVFLMASERGWRKDLLWIGVVFLPYFALIANYAQWWGEWCPPARYIASVLPLLALPFAISLDNIKGLVYKGIYGVLLLVSLLVTAGFMYQPQWMYNQPDIKSQIVTQGIPLLLEPVLGDAVAKQVAGAVANSLPSFVIPYFGYIRSDASGDYWSGVAWERSVVPVLFVGIVIVVSLALAWWPRRGSGGGPQAIMPAQDDEVAQEAHQGTSATHGAAAGAPTLSPVDLSHKESTRP
jgi:hypothetical protein